jgi:regulation of enolase protein 1 (concanavalin A-like superfamily)
VGDGEIIARLVTITNTNGWAKAGLMMRETTAANSRHVFMCLSSQNGSALQRRASVGGPSASTSGAGGGAPRWLRLVRAGNDFTGYESNDGVTWTPVGTVNLPLPATIHAGLAVTSHNDGVLCTATFDQLSLAGVDLEPPAAPSGLTASAVSASQIDLAWVDHATGETGFQIERSLDATSFTLVATVASNRTTFSDGGRTAATTYTYRVRAGAGSFSSTYTNHAAATTPAAAPAPIWSHVDIGAVGLVGSDDAGGNTITVRGAGDDVWGNVDAFRFVYRTLAADGTVEAQVSSLTNTHAWAKAGVMIRESLAAGARNVFAFLTPANGVAVQARLALGGNTVFNAGPWGAVPPHWVRLVRTGARIDAYTSADYASWTLVATHTLTGTTTVYVGFAVTAHDRTRLNSSVFTDPFITP